MTTITAVELRKNMGAIFKRVQNGEKIAVTYRGSRPVVLAQELQKKDTAAQSGLDLLLSLPRPKNKLDPSKSVKELYHEILEQKYNYNKK